MKTLADAWEWYLSTRDNLRRMQRIGQRYWESIPWETAVIGRDDEFRILEASLIEAETKKSLAPIDDLAVVVLFSVFEAVVRSYLVKQIRPEADRLSDPILKQAADEAIRGVEEGSFYRRVLEPLKEQGRVPADLVTQVDQVRDYRNWVAHGGRGRAKNNVDPRSAYERLGAFLDALDIAVEPEEREAEHPEEEPE
jgi:hypothetical protein